MVVLGFAGDDSAQQALHFLKATQLFGHHGQVITQVGVSSKALQALRQQIVGAAVLLGFPQQLNFGIEFLPRVRSSFFRLTANQFACLVKLALPGQNAGSAQLRIEQFLWAVNAREPAFRLRHVIAFFGDLCQS